MSVLLYNDFHLTLCFVCVGRAVVKIFILFLVKLRNPYSSLQWFRYSLRAMALLERCNPKIVVENVEFHNVCSSVRLILSV